jgi:energy-coupling factor transport system permease protein
VSQFEFLRSVPFGQYLPVGSILHRLDPRARMVAFTVIILALTFSRSLMGLLIGCAVVLVGLRVGKIPYRFAFQGLLPPLPFLFLLAILQIFLNASPPNESILAVIGPVRITLSDLAAGAKLLIRFTGLILGIGLATYTISTGEMTQGLNVMFRPLAKMGLPAQDLVMMAQVTLRFLPMLAQTAERIAKSQASRGADWDSRPRNLIARVRQVIPVIVPLFLSSLHRAENMALAMDARAYGSSVQRTSLVELRLKAADGLLLGISFLAGAAILILK